MVDRFLAKLPDKASGGILELPDGRKATIKEVTPVDTKSQNLSGRQWKLKTDDGQYLYIKKLERAPRARSEQIGTSEGIGKARVKKKDVRFGSKAKAVKLIVRDLERSRSFYHEVLGLKVARESRTLVNLGGIISLISREHLSEFEVFDRDAFQTKAILCIECSNIEACYDRVRGLTESKVSPIQDRSGRKVFRCVDLDGNVIEVFESAAGKKPDKADTSVSGENVQ